MGAGEGAEVGAARQEEGVDVVPGGDGADGDDGDGGFVADAVGEGGLVGAAVGGAFVGDDLPGGERDGAAGVGAEALADAATLEAEGKTVGVAGGAERLGEAAEQLLDEEVFTWGKTARDYATDVYARQAKQFLRNVVEGFDERNYGFSSVVDMLRAAGKEGILRVERDRQGAVRVFAGPKLGLLLKIDVRDFTVQGLLEFRKDSMARKRKAAKKSNKASAARVQAMRKRLTALIANANKAQAAATSRRIVGRRYRRYGGCP